MQILFYTIQAFIHTQTDMEMQDVIHIHKTLKQKQSYKVTDFCIISFHCTLKTLSISHRDNNIHSSVTLEGNIHQTSCDIFLFFSEPTR